MDTKTAEFAQKLGARIVQLRKEHNFAQERLATLARMNKGYLSSVESGQRIPSVGMLQRLSKVLQVQLFDLFVFPDTSPWDRLWEELRKGENPVVEQLRSAFGLNSARPGRTGSRGQRSAKATKTAAAKSAKKKTARAEVQARTRARPTSKTTTRKATRPGTLPNRGAKRRR